MRPAPRLRSILTVRILFLGNSNESLNLPPGTPLRHRIIEEQLSATYGPATVIVKAAWPTKDFPKVLAKWIEDLRPDVVYLNVAEYWCLYESIPLRIERSLPKFGKKLAGAGTALAETPWVSHNRVFRGVRQAGQSVLTGAVQFSPEEIVERMTECLRVCLRNEGIAVVVDGQRGRRPHATTKRWQARVEARRQQVHRGLKAECARLHVVYGGDDIPQWQTHPEGMAGHRDGLHQAAAGQVWMANEAVGLIRDALGQVGVTPSAGTTAELSSTGADEP